MMTLACRDMGMDCDYVAKGENWDAMMEDMKGHVMSVHNMSEDDMTPEMMEKAKQMTKEE